MKASEHTKPEQDAQQPNPPGPRQRTSERVKQLGLAAAIAALAGLGMSFFGLEPSAELIDQVFSVITGGTP